MALILKEKYKIIDSIYRKLISFFGPVFKMLPKPISRVVRKIYLFLYKNTWYRLFFRKPEPFIGWGMETTHANPWDGEIKYNDIFLKANNDIKSGNYTISLGGGPEKIDALRWRHWIGMYSVRFAVEFCKNQCQNQKLEFAEFGVADGLSTSFALRQLKDLMKGNDNYTYHLYDYFGTGEIGLENQYDELKINRTKSNLSEFEKNTIFHQGVIPDIFYQSSKLSQPQSLCFFHIDLNSGERTLDTLKYFYPMLLRGGVILFDDYGWKTGYGHDTKKVVDKFFYDKGGMLMPLPTGQAIYYH